MTMDQYRAVEGLAALADYFDFFLIDQFGVLHDGVRPYKGSIGCLAKLKERGKKVVLLSNSGKRAEANVERLTELGFSRELFDQVVTSGEVAWHGIAGNAFGEKFVSGKTMFLIGHEEYDYGYENIGMRLVTSPNVADFILIAASRAPKMSLDQYGDLLATAAASSIPALCCNPDRLMLTTEGLQPSAGEIARLYEKLGGTVHFVGKPYSSMYAFAKRRNPELNETRCLAIGDSIEHDIQGGRKADLATALVLTGLSSGLADGKLESRLATHCTYPDFVMPSLSW